MRCPGPAHGEILRGPAPSGIRGVYGRTRRDLREGGAGDPRRCEARTPGSTRGARGFLRSGGAVLERATGVRCSAWRDRRRWFFSTTPRGELTTPTEHSNRDGELHPVAQVRGHASTRRCPVSPATSRASRRSTSRGARQPARSRRSARRWRGWCCPRPSAREPRVRAGSNVSSDPPGGAGRACERPPRGRGRNHARRHDGRHRLGGRRERRCSPAHYARSADASRWWSVSPSRDAAAAASPRERTSSFLSTAET